MPGRPRVLADAAKRKTVQGILAAGGTRDMAARYVGVHPRTLANEIRRDAEFQRQIAEAEIGFEIGLLKTIREAGGSATGWRAAAWQLERRFPERYRRQGAALFTVGEVEDLLRQLCDIVLDETPEAATRERIVRRFDVLLGGLSTGSAAGRRKRLTQKR